MWREMLASYIPAAAGPANMQLLYENTLAGGLAQKEIMKVADK